MPVSPLNPDSAGSAILLEMRPAGRAMEVAAVDEASGIEVRFAAPANTPLEAVQRLARRKINYVKSRQPPDCADAR